MKTLFLLITTLFLSFMLQGQSVLHYAFENSLPEVNGNGPTLTVLGNEGIHVEDTLNEIGSAKKWVYRFETNSGLQFDNSSAGNFLGENYTIELYFVFDNLSSWKRVVDWKNRKTDNGAYVYYGQLNFYNIETSGEAPVEEGEYTYYVITRNGENDELIIYTDAETHITFTDELGDALMDEDNVLNFFHDDLIVPNEASSGAVAMLKLYNYTLDSATISDKFEDLAGNVFYIGENKIINTTISTFPNPVNDNLTIDLSNFSDQETVTLKLVNVIGVTVYEAERNAGSINNIRLNTSDIQNGIYVLIAESASKHAMGKVLIQR